MKALRVCIFLLLISFACFVSWGAVRAVKAIQFNQNCIQYIKRAADASSVELAKEELAKVINYCEKNDLTEGVVSIILSQPKNDVGYWYKNLTTAYAELDSLAEDASSVERTNMLMKIRETLTDAEESGVEVTYPNGISVYPNNVGYFLWAILSLVGMVAFFSLGCAYVNRY